MLHTQAYGQSKAGPDSWIACLRNCARSIEELAARYYPDAVTVARALQWADEKHLRTIVKNAANVLRGYRKAMIGRIVETKYHYVAHGTIFFSDHFISITFETMHIAASPGPGIWSGQTIGAPTTAIGDAGSLFAAIIGRLCENLTKATRLDRCIRDMIHDYIAAPTRCITA